MWMSRTVLPYLLACLLLFLPQLLDASTTPYQRVEPLEALSFASKKTNFSKKQNKQLCKKRKKRVRRWRKKAPLKTQSILSSAGGVIIVTILFTLSVALAWTLFFMGFGGWLFLGVTLFVGLFNLAFSTVYIIEMLTGGAEAIEWLFVLGAISILSSIGASIGFFSGLGTGITLLITGSLFMLIPLMLVLVIGVLLLLYFLIGWLFTL